MERGGGVGGGHAVAGVAADGTGVADLGAAHHVHRLAQHVDIPLDDGIVGDVGKAGEAADADILLGVDRHAPHLIALLNGDQRLTGALTLAHLHQHVGAAGDDLRLGVLQPQAHRVLYVLGLVQCQHIIHSSSLLSPE